MTATIGVGVTGCIGSSEEEQPAGSVFIAACWGERLAQRELHLLGEPDQVVHEVVERVIELVLSFVDAVPGVDVAMASGS